MKRIFSALLVLAMLLSLAACGGSAAQAPAAAPAADAPMQYITPEDAKGLLEDSGYVFFDIRKTADSSTKTIPGAEAWDMDAAKEGDAEAGKATMTKATQGLDKKIILVCYSGKRYAQAATNALSAIGYDMSKVYTLEGGFTAWSEKFPDLAVAPGEAAAPAPADVTLRVSMGTNNPYGFLDEKEQPAGFVVDTWNEIGKRTGFTIEFQYMDGMDAHYGSIDAGKVDVLGIQVAITDAIRDKYDFTTRYAYNIIRMVSLKDKPYESLADLAGKKICIAPGKLSEFFERYNSEHPDLTIELVTTEGNIYEELDLGRFEAFPMTIMAFEKMQRSGAADPYKMFGEAIITEENVFPMRKDIPDEVKAAVDAAIKDMLDDGTLAEISQKWYFRDVTQPFTEE